MPTRSWSSVVAIQCGCIAAIQKFFYAVVATTVQSQLEPFVVGLYCGKTKLVDIFEYLDDFVKDLSKLLSDGITENEVHGDVAVDCFVCDAPACAYV